MRQSYGIRSGGVLEEYEVGCSSMRDSLTGRITGAYNRNNQHGCGMEYP